MSEENHKVSIFSIGVKTFRILILKPSIAIPFIFVGLANLYALVLLYFAPQQPAYKLLGPPIRKLFGPEFLEFPRNFDLILKLMPQISVFVMATIGLFFTAYALVMLKKTLIGEKFYIKEGLIRACIIYIPMLIVFVLIYLLIELIANFVMPLISLLNLQGMASILVAVGLNFFLTAVIQSVFFFVFPAICMGERNFFVDLKSAMVLFWNNKKCAFVLVFFPILLNIIPIYLKLISPTLVQSFGFEIILAVVAVGILVNVILDVLITLFSGVAYSELLLSEKIKEAVRLGELQEQNEEN